MKHKLKNRPIAVIGDPKKSGQKIIAKNIRNSAYHKFGTYVQVDLGQNAGYIVIRRKFDFFNIKPTFLEKSFGKSFSVPNFDMKNTNLRLYY